MLYNYYIIIFKYLCTIEIFSTWIVMHIQYGVVQASKPDFINKCYTN